MDFDKLVELITEEVMKRIKKAGIELEKEKKLLYLDSEDSQEYKFFSNDLKSFGYKLVCLKENTEELTNYDGIITSNLKIRELSNLVLGVSCGLKESTIIQGLLEGVPVYVLENGLEYKKYFNTANKVLYNVFSSYEDKLSQFGAIIGTEEKILNTLKNKKHDKKDISGSTNNQTTEAINETVYKVEETVQFKEAKTLEIKERKLISESKIRELYRSGIRRIIVPKKIVITPLAKDFARINHMEIVKQ